MYVFSFQTTIKETIITNIHQPGNEEDIHQVMINAPGWLSKVQKANKALQAFCKAEIDEKKAKPILDNFALLFKQDPPIVFNKIHI